MYIEKNSTNLLSSKIQNRPSSFDIEITPFKLTYHPTRFITGFYFSHPRAYKATENRSI